MHRKRRNGGTQVVDLVGIVLVLTRHAAAFAIVPVVDGQGGVALIGKRRGIGTRHLFLHRCHGPADDHGRMRTGAVGQVEIADDLGAVAAKRESL